MTIKIAHEQADAVAIDRVMGFTPDGTWPNQHWPWYLVAALQAQQRQIVRLQQQLDHLNGDRK